jgi:hypothetical protein
MADRLGSLFPASSALQAFVWTSCKEISLRRSKLEANF